MARPEFSDRPGASELPRLPLLKDVVTESWAVLRRDGLKLTLLSLPAVALYQTASFIMEERLIAPFAADALQRLRMSLGQLDDLAQFAENIRSLRDDTLAFAALALPVALFLYAILLALLTPMWDLYTARRLAGRETSAWEAWAHFARCLPAVLTAALVSTLIVTALFFACFAPGIAFQVYTVFILEYAVLRGRSGIQAIGDSIRLVRGRFWPIFGHMLVLSLSANAAQLLVGLPLFIFLFQTSGADIHPLVRVTGATAGGAALCLSVGIFSILRTAYFLKLETQNP